MKNFRMNFLIILVLMLSLNTIAQEKVIVGKVTAFQSIPLNNVKVLSKKSKNETVTDKDGLFSIQSFDEDVFLISCAGFKNQKVKIKKGEDTIKVNLFFINSPKNMETTVLNGSIDEQTLTDALANLPNQEKDYSRYSDIYALLKGEFPYLKIMGSTVTLAIPQSINSGGSCLLIVDDNYVDNISYVRPLHVTSVKVLKGPDASTYGVRGSNGVIIIKTFGKK